MDRINSYATQDIWASFFFFTGISLAFRSLFSILVVLALGIVLVWRVFAEEALMKQEFGKDWDAYCAVLWRILPLAIRN